MFKSELGAEESKDSGIYQGKVEQGVQYGPPAPLYSVPIPSFFGNKETLYWVAGGLVGAWVLYTYVFKDMISDESQY